MDLTPAFFDHWREHRHLDYMDKVAEIFDQAAFDEPWLEGARAHALAQEASASLGHAGIQVDVETVKAIVDRDEDTGLDAGHVAAVAAYAAAHRAALAVVQQEAEITPELLDELHARLVGSGAAAGAPVDELCRWLDKAPYDRVHPVVMAAVAHVELLRLRRWTDGNARLARLVMLMLLDRGGYGYRGLLAPSTHWSDPRALLPAQPAEELQPQKAETLPAVEHVVHGVARALHDMVNRVRAEESLGSFAAMAFGWPVQP